jgi:hypothetical protein
MQLRQSRPLPPRQPLRLSDAGDAQSGWIGVLTTERYNLAMLRTATISEADGWPELFRLEPRSAVTAHRHTGDVHAFNLAGTREVTDMIEYPGGNGEVIESVNELCHRVDGVVVDRHAPIVEERDRHAVGKTARRIDTNHLHGSAVVRCAHRTTAEPCRERATR